MTIHAASLDRKKKAFELWDIPERERMDQGLPVSQAAICNFLGVGRNTLVKWEEEYQKYISGDGNMRVEVIANLRALSKRSPEACKALLKAIGEYGEKDEGNLSAADYIRLAREARGRILGLSGELGREFSLSEQSPLLLDEVCGDTEQEHEAGSEVAGVGLSA